MYLICQKPSNLLLQFRQWEVETKRGCCHNSNGKFDLLGENKENNPSEKVKSLSNWMSW